MTVAADRPATTAIFPDAANAPVGLIGLGHVGLALATRIVAAGQRPIGFRRGDPSAFEALGGLATGTVHELIARCPTVILALPDGAASADIVREISDQARPTTIIDMTSMTPQLSQYIATIARAAGHIYLEAPISGSIDMIRAGKATIFAGGDAGLVGALAPLFTVLAERVVMTGAIGTASVVKAAALMLIGVNLAATAEALAFAESHGVEPERAMDALIEGPASSGALRHRGPLMSGGRYDPTSGSLDGLQQLLETIRPSASTSVGLLDCTINYLARASSAGHGERDPAAIFEILRPDGTADDR